MAKTVFYCRVSTKDQNINLQRDAATKMGVKSEHIYVETASGSRTNRPVLAQAIAACKRGDTLACYKLDRVRRSVAHVHRNTRHGRGGWVQADCTRCHGKPVPHDTANACEEGAYVRSLAERGAEELRLAREEFQRCGQEWARQRGNTWTR